MTTEPSHRQRFAEVARRPDREIDLGEAALLVAAEEYPDLDVERWLGKLDELAATVKPRVAPLTCDYERLAALMGFLYGEYGLCGNAGDYYDPRNSFLNDVLERRLGIPISLAVVAIEVGRRVGVPLVGLGFPGHFLLRHALHPQLVIDPFDGGRLLTSRECGEILDRLSAGRIRFRESLLQPVGPRQILVRMLANLRGIYAYRGEVGKALAIMDRIVLLDPCEACHRRERGLLRLKAGDLAGGVEDLELYLAGCPEEDDAEELQQVMTTARRRAPAVH